MVPFVVWDIFFVLSSLCWHNFLMKFFTYITCLNFYISFALSQSYGVIGDAGHWNKNAKMVRDSIRSSGITKLILPGDNIYDTTLEYEEVWSHWIKKGLDPFVVALGNHYRSIDEELQFFGMPYKYFSISEQGIKFIVLDSETLTELDEQAVFLENELNSGEEIFRVIVFHHPPATISYRHGWKEREAFHLKMSPVFERSKDKINLIINGHDHLASLFSFNNIPVVVSGAVFESRPAPSFDYTREDGAIIKTQWANTEGFYWVRLDFDTKRERIWINFVQAEKDEVSCSILLFKNSILKKSNCLQLPAISEIPVFDQKQEQNRTL